MKAREYLIGQGLAKAGRGKFSNEAKAQLNSAIESGITFTDYDGAGKASEPTYETPPMTWPTGRAVFKETGKKVSMSEACNDCGYSLSWCECASPRVLGRTVVISPN